MATPHDTDRTNIDLDEAMGVITSAEADKLRTALEAEAQQKTEDLAASRLATQSARDQAAAQAKSAEAALAAAASAKRLSDALDAAEQVVKGSQPAGGIDKTADISPGSGKPVGYDPAEDARLIEQIKSMRGSQGSIDDIDKFGSAPPPTQAPTPTVYPAARNVEHIPTVGPAADHDPGLQAQLDAQVRKEKEQQDAASRQRGSSIYGYGTLARSMTYGGMNSASGIGQGVAQLGASGALGAVGAIPGFGAAAMGIGAAVDAGAKVIAGGFNAARAAIETGGTLAKEAFRNDGLGMMTTAGEAVAKGLEGIPIAGGMAASALRLIVAPASLLKGVLEAVTGRAKELARYSPEIALAQAESNMKQMFADMKEAGSLGPKYAEMVRKEQEINQRFQESLQPLKEKIMEALPTLLELVSSVVPVVITGFKLVVQVIENSPWTRGLVNIAQAQRDTADILEQIRNQGKDNMDPDPWVAINEAMAALQIPNAVMNPQAGQFARNNAMPFLLNPPRN